MNCKHENQTQNFCGNCGAALKEKCAECGEMEPIGRKFCEKEIFRLQKEQLLFANTGTYVKKARNIIFWYSLLFLSFVFGGFYCSIVLAEAGNTGLSAIIGLPMALLLVLFLLFMLVEVPKIERKATNKDLKKFLEEFPQHKEILEHEEKGE